MGQQLLQKKFGKCDADFLVDKGYCAATCNRCSSYMYPPPGPACADIAPDPVYTCEQQVSANLKGSIAVLPSPLLSRCGA